MEIHMTPLVRPATAEDAEFLAWVMLTASRGNGARGLWDLLLDASDAVCLEYLRRLALSEPRSLCHYSSFLVAETEGIPAAALCGFAFQEGGWATVAQAQANVRRELHWTDADLAASEQRMAPLWTCFLPDLGADWGIENVATRAEFRRTGLTQLLLQQVLCQGAKQGCRLTQISTMIGNDAAISAYEKAGFRLSDEKRCPPIEAALGTPGFVRLIREL